MEILSIKRLSPNAYGILTIYNGKFLTTGIKKINKEWRLLIGDIGLLESESVRKEYIEYLIEHMEISEMIKTYNIDTTNPLLTETKRQFKGEVSFLFSWIEETRG
jgi:hypothetical protein